MRDGIEKESVEGVRRMIALIISNSVLVIGIVIFLIASFIDEKKPIVIKEAKYLREYYERKLRAAENNAAENAEDATRYRGLYESELEKNRKVDGTERELELVRSEKAVLEDKVRKLKEDNESLEATIEDMAKENQSLKQAKTESGAKKKCTRKTK